MRYCSNCGQTFGYANLIECPCCKKKFPDEVVPIEEPNASFFNFSGRIGRINFLITNTVVIFLLFLASDINRDSQDGAGPPHSAGIN
jgi:hypothetical protein